VHLIWGKNTVIDDKTMADSENEIFWVSMFRFADERLSGLYGSPLTRSVAVAVFWLWLACVTGLLACGGSGAQSVGGDGLDGSVDSGRTQGSRAVVEVAGDAQALDTEEARSREEALSLLESVVETERWQLDGLESEVHVVRTEMNVPHIYASHRRDLFMAHGFVMARDRFFMMDLARRLGLGRLSELMGDVALTTDKTSRGTAMTYVADRFHAHLTAEQKDWIEAFVDGINRYIESVSDGALPAPSEMELVAPLFGAETPVDLMAPFTVRDVAGMLAVVLYNTSYETGEVSRAAAVDALPTLFLGKAFESLRTDGAWHDIYEDVMPIKPVFSADGFGVEGSGLQTRRGGLADSRIDGGRGMPRSGVHASMLARLTHRLRRQEKILNRDAETGYGSNAWAVSGAKSPSGEAVLAGDGHLPLSVPSILYQIGLDTALLGEGDTHQLGLTIPGFPVMPIGTNGKVAWSQTQFAGDVTDWYREELKLDAQGLPESSRFGEEWMPLTRIDETYVVADVAVLGSEGRTELWAHWITFDGRWLAEIEGRSFQQGDPLGEDESLVDLQGELVVPGDMDEDGVVTAISFDYTGLDVSSMLTATDGLGHADDIASFRESTRGLVAYSQNLVAIDHHGDIFYTGYQPVPCRGYLDRQGDGTWAQGADPGLLLDGTRYQGFTIPTDANGMVDEGPGHSDPYQCVVPFEEYPQAWNPSRGYVMTANNDPGNLTLDGSLTNDAWYLGGPWNPGFRGDAIASGIEAAIDADDAGVDGMAALQHGVKSPLGTFLVPALQEAISFARGIDESESGASPWQGRLKAFYDERATRIDEVDTRLAAWAERGFVAASGVETFYQQPDELAADDAVATMIFNAWLGRFMQRVFDDEGLPGAIFRGSGAKVRALCRLVSARGAGNPIGLASFHEDTEESIFFDDLQTVEVEHSRELMLAALVDALDFLEGASSGAGSGGFGTADMGAWLWGLRHQVKFESLLADFLGDAPEYALLTQQFAIDTEVLPLTTLFEPNDPRIGLQWFPRDGDQYCIDAANPGLSGTNFTYGSGPVMRMVIALKDDDVWGQNIIPGGQSGLIDSEHYADQVALWLANQALPLRFHLEDVVQGATGREVLVPSP
jgi:penicillin amidase